MIGLLHILGEVALLVGAMMVLRFARPGPEGLRDAALDHGMDIVRVEQKLNIYYERQLQSFFLKRPSLEQVPNHIYTVGYYPLIGATALWLYWRDRDRYRILRNSFLGTLALSYAVFLLYPVAPPRYYPELGFVDTLAAEGETVHPTRNPFAAVPSLHFAAALLSAGTIFAAVRSWWIRLLVTTIPGSMVIGIVATGNHFFLDALAAVPIVGLAALFARRMKKGRQSGRKLSKPQRTFEPD